MARWWRRWWGRDGRDALHPLYRAIVAAARRPVWYREGQVPDTRDGRFDMVAAILSLVLLRLEAEGVEGREPAAHLAELFVEDMDGQLREEGVGDVIVGKHVGRMMGALGGRLGAFREALAGGDVDGAIERNLYRGALPPAPAVTAVRDRLLGLRASLAATPVPTLLAGGWHDGSA